MAAKRKAKGGRKTASSKRKAGKPTKRKSSDPAQCEFILCEDPNTGQIIVRPKGECPPEFVERIADGMRKKGVIYEFEPEVEERRV